MEILKYLKNNSNRVRIKETSQEKLINKVYFAQFYV